MEIENRIIALEEEIRTTKEELSLILLEIRTYVMEADTPIPNALDRERLREELDANREA